MGNLSSSRDAALDQDEEMINNNEDETSMNPSMIKGVGSNNLNAATGNENEI